MNETSADLDLFDTGHLRRMVHHNAIRTEVDAAAKVLACCSRLHSEVMGAFLEHGAMTAGEAEKLSQFAQWKPSTVRKRISELKEAGRLVADGRRGGMTVWRVA